jgi:hypothetical protein
MEVGTNVRLRVEIMGPGNHEPVGESQSGLIMVSPTVSAHTQNMYGRTAPLRVMR